MKSIIVYTRELKAQNLYPKRIISPPHANKCCAARMEVLGRPRVDEQGRRFCYKRCKVCGFALRYFLDSVGTVLTPAAPDVRSRKAVPVKDQAAPAPGHSLDRRPGAAARKPAPSRHVPRQPLPQQTHAAGAGRKNGTRRRR